MKWPVAHPRKSATSDMRPAIASTMAPARRRVKPGSRFDCRRQAALRQRNGPGLPPPAARQALGPRCWGHVPRFMAKSCCCFPPRLFGHSAKRATDRRLGGFSFESRGDCSGTELRFSNIFITWRDHHGQYWQEMYSKAFVWLLFKALCVQCLEKSYHFIRFL
jgi:hypothetical protein